MQLVADCPQELDQDAAIARIGMMDTPPYPESPVVLILLYEGQCYTAMCAVPHGL